jgi:hypothetical protein
VLRPVLHLGVDLFFHHHRELVTMKTNDIKKGMRIKLANGWYGTMMDNKRGNIRLAEVEGIHKEIGSIYAHDIISVEQPDGVWHVVEHTKQQKQTADAVSNLGL